MAQTMDSNKLADFVEEARKDPQFIKDIDKFLTIVNGHYKLKDYGLE